MILRIYFRRRTARRPIEFDLVLQPSSKDPDYARDYARRTAEAVRAAMCGADAEPAPDGKPLRHCANIEYRLRIHKRDGEMFWDEPIVTCSPDERTATCNAAMRIREILEAKR